MTGPTKTWASAMRVVPWWRRGSTWVTAVLIGLVVAGAVAWARRPRPGMGWFRHEGGYVFFDGHDACRTEVRLGRAPSGIPQWPGWRTPGVCRPARGPVRVGWYRWRGAAYLVPPSRLPCRYASLDDLGEASAAVVPLPDEEVLPELERTSTCEPVPPEEVPALEEGFVMYRRTLYRSDGQKRLCAFRDWEEYVEAGGANGTWVELDELPKQHTLTGPCVPGPDAGP